MQEEFKNCKNSCKIVKLLKIKHCGKSKIKNNILILAPKMSSRNRSPGYWLEYFTVNDYKQNKKY